MTEMDSFHVISANLPRLSLFVIHLAVAVYFSLLPRKRHGTWGLVAAFWALTISDLGFLADDTIHTAWIDAVKPLLQFGGIFGFNWAWLLIAYKFLGDPYPRESRWVLRISGAITIAAWTVFPLHFVFGINLVIGQLTLVLTTWALLLFLTAIIVFLRRARRSSLHHGAQNLLREAVTNAFVGGAVISFIQLLGYVFYFLGEVGVMSSGLFSQLYLLIGAIFTVGLITIYVNYVPEPTSFNVKIVGFAFVMVVTVLGIASVIVFKEPIPVSESSPDTIRFELDEEGRYTVLRRHIEYETATEGALAFTDGGGAQYVPIKFPFFFAGSIWDGLWIDEDGYVTFGKKERTISYGTSTPWIAPLMIDMAPSTTVENIFASSDSTSLTLTWQNVPVYFRRESVTVQLVLDADSSISFRYLNVPKGIPWYRGISPGVKDPEEWRDLAVAVAAPPGTALVEDPRPDWFEAEETRSKPFAWLILGAGFFMIIAFPIYLRAGLTRPLQRLMIGVREATEGNLDTKVQVGARDEIGQLTENFNKMTSSLRTADLALQVYAEQLEARVEARTIELGEKNERLESTLHELKTTQQQLIHAEKMASLGQLMAGIAHEIKNPLNFINNFAEINVELAEELRQTVGNLENADLESLFSDLDKNAQVIIEHGKRADSIVQAMMQHASGSTGIRETVDINGLVSESIALAKYSKRAKVPEFDVKIIRKLKANTGQANIVSQEIGRVLLNLLSNAFDALHQYERPGDKEYVPTVTVRTKRIDGKVEIRIEDNGPGIPAENKKKIFDPFFTTKPTNQGTGLGLSLSFDIVKQGHAGKLIMVDTDGGGATFVITLAAAEAD